MSKKLDSLSGQVSHEIRKAIMALEKDNAAFISPSLVEKKVMAALDPEEYAPLLVSHLSRLQIRQMCRQQLSARNDEMEKNIVKQGVLNPSIFDIQLQDRYPVKINGEDGYLIRANMEKVHYLQNAARLSSEARTKNLHADALRAEAEERFPDPADKAA